MITTLQRIRTRARQVPRDMPSGWWILPAAIGGMVGWYFIWRAIKELI